MSRTDKYWYSRIVLQKEFELLKQKKRNEEEEKEKAEKQRKLQHEKFKHIVALTCNRNTNRLPPKANEIVEIAAVLYDAGVKKRLDDFHRALEPTEEPLQRPSEEQVSRIKFCDAMEHFWDWHSVLCFKWEVTGVIAVWDNVDVQLIIDECNRKSVRLSDCIKNWICLVDIYMPHYGWSRFPAGKPTLKEALNERDREFIGLEESCSDRVQNLIVMIDILADKIIFTTNSLSVKN